MNRPLYYLGCPIAHHTPAVVVQRHKDVSEVLAQFMERQWLVYSPLSHHFAVRDRFPHSWSFWEKPSIGMLDKCDVMMILMLDGWRDSVGVTAETEHAIATRKQILYVPFPLQWELGELKVDQIWLNSSTVGATIKDT